MILIQRKNDTKTSIPNPSYSQLATYHQVPIFELNLLLTVDLHTVHSYRYVILYSYCTY